MHAVGGELCAVSAQGGGLPGGSRGKTMQWTWTRHFATATCLAGVGWILAAAIAAGQTTDGQTYRNQSGTTQSGYGQPGYGPTTQSGQYGTNQSGYSAQRRDQSQSTRDASRD